MAVFDVFNPLQNVIPRFTEEQLDQIIEWFDANSKPQLIINEGSPTLVVTIEKFVKFFELKTFHRRSFHYPSYSEIMIEAEKLKAGVTRMLTKEQVIFILNKWVLEPDLKHELSLAFKIFDTENRNYLEIVDIKAIVTGYADVFHENESRELLRDANVRGDGIVYYEDFIESLFSIAPELNDIKASYLYDNPDEDPSVPPEPVVEEEPPAPPSPPLPPPPAKGKGKRKGKK
ncbi:hypothetical protein K1T71_009756 [Dendrolimus kikuchii]|uniref:Uncharacterized protein n=1 Tax=Dendrolimus kikuchii TaxID=765133 RepID=A0ACC1CSP3_9NEOP|nr:hypothetical protein K1T71_009756 [Dendrolimus kikuchii]